MKMASIGGQMTQLIDCLKGRENFHTWTVAMKAYLQRGGCWDTIEANSGQLCTDAGKKTKALSIIILSLDPQLYVHVENLTSPKDAWEALNKAFEDSGLARRISLLRKLTTTKLEDLQSVGEYINIIITTANQLKGIKMNVPDE